MKLCYVLPQYHKNSAENFFHIANFLSELGKKVELFLIIEHSDCDPKINNIEEDCSNELLNHKLVQVVKQRKICNL